jgi:S-disulfanyl-L-cysteine oxidoreductase SoxD
MPRFQRFAVLTAALLCSGIVLAGQEKLPKIWDGVYTAAQAMRGKHIYEERCSSCHGSDLTGGDGPALIGGTFSRSWSSRHLDRLFVKLRDRMPADDVQAVSDKDKVDVLAYLLENNGFPAGTQELPLDPEYLSTIQIVGKNGPEPAPAGAMVQVMGCLTGDGKNWKLTNATEPVVSTMDDPEADAKAAAKHPLGTNTVGLLDVFPNPGDHKGHKMLAKGLLIRNDGIALNVLHLGMIAATCVP